MLPAFAHARRNSELAALVSDDPTKLRTLGRRYDVKRLLHYDDFEGLAASGDVDAAYIALPNHLHHTYTLAAAAAGLHVLFDSATVEAVDTIASAGGCAWLTTYNGAGHDDALWSSPYLESGLWSWLFAQTNSSAPR